MRQVAQIMGMPITLDIPNCEDKAVYTSVFDLLRSVDRRFSPYKKNSELSRYNRGKISQKQLSAEMKQVIKACRLAQKSTKGYFSAWYKQEFDPSGYVKGWAIARAGERLKNKGYKTFCIAAGGDILAASSGRKVWNIGIQDPTNSKRILNMLSITNGAVATSGNYERGAHIINPKTGKPATGFLSFTVVGPDIIRADVLATAGFAMGIKAIEFINSKPGYRCWLVDGRGKLLSSRDSPTMLSQ